ILSAISVPIQDCDEVYNYWEPFHFLLFGHGKQTWEFAPQYSLRSWFPLKLYYYLVKSITHVFKFDTKIQVFYAVRICISMFSGVCDLLFVRSIRNTLSMQLMTLSYAFGMIPFPKAEKSREKLRICFILLFSISATVFGWPYSAILVVPPILEYLFNFGSITNPSNETQNKNFISRTVSKAMTLFFIAFICTLLTVLPSIIFDSYYYQKVTFPSLNQVLYNVIPKYFDPVNYQLIGPNLYGTEHWSYYFVNSVINWNLIFVFACAAIPLLAFHYILLKSSVLKVKSKQKSKLNNSDVVHTSSNLVQNYFLIFTRLLPPYLLFFVLSTQPHKEERFLYPIYPLFCFAAGTSIELLLSISDAFAAKYIPRSKKVWMAFAKTLLLFLAAFSAILGLSRSFALYRNYKSEIEIYKFLPFDSTADLNSFMLNSQRNDKEMMNSIKTSEYYSFDAKRTVCIGKDWYRFPSQFHLPLEYKLVFLRSRFDGLLPGDFLPVEKSGSVIESTSAYVNDTNCLNRFEDSHVVAGDPRKACDYIVDVNHTPNISENENEDEIEPNYSKRTKEYSKVKCLPHLNSSESPIWIRTFYFGKYITGLLDKLFSKNSSNRWGEICLLKPAASE
ncbi:hypothetical protein BB560_003425, partial [Smittium megazygosporum]